MWLVPDRCQGLLQGRFLILSSCYLSRLEEWGGGECPAPEVRGLSIINGLLMDELDNPASSRYGGSIPGYWNLGALSSAIVCC